MKEEMDGYCTQEGEQLHNGLDNFRVGEIATDDRTEKTTYHYRLRQEPSNRASHEDHARSDGDVAVVAEISDHRFGNAEKPVRDTMEKTDDQTKVVVLRHAEQ